MQYAHLSKPRKTWRERMLQRATGFDSPANLARHHEANAKRAKQKAAKA